MEGEWLMVEPKSRVSRDYAVITETNFEGERDKKERRTKAGMGRDGMAVKTEM